MIYIITEALYDYGWHEHKNLGLLGAVSMLISFG